MSSSSSSFSTSLVIFSARESSSTAMILSAILYLQTPHSGGDLTLFDKKWCKDDEYMRDPEFGYQSNIVDGATKSSISPVVGNMVILNPKFYHKIESVQGTKHRVSIGFFFAEHSSNNLCAWA